LVFQKTFGFSRGSKYISAGENPLKTCISNSVVDEWLNMDISMGIYKPYKILSLLFLICVKFLFSKIVILKEIIQL
jgi:hypothetical protein